MSISQAYKQLLETFNRTLGQGRRYGVDYEYNPVKKPTWGSIRRLGKELEKLKTQIWFKSLERKRTREAIKQAQEFVDLINSSKSEEQPSEVSETLSDEDSYNGNQDQEENQLVEEADTIIENFKKFVGDMEGANYQLQYISFGDKSSSNARQPGIDAREKPVEKILEALDEVIDSLGKTQVAINIKKAGERLERLVEELVFAIYMKKYSRYGGGRAAYNTAIELEIKGILSGSY